MEVNSVISQEKVATLNIFYILSVDFGHCGNDHVCNIEENGLGMTALK